MPLWIVLNLKNTHRPDCHINKTDDITSCKNNHSFFKKEFQREKNSSAFRDIFCQDGRLPKDYWKHSKTNRHLLQVQCCEEKTAWCVKSSKKCILKRCERKREVFVCLIFRSAMWCQTVFWQDFFQGMWIKATVLTSWGHSGWRKNRFNWWKKQDVPQILIQ